jgi:tetraprenyl-beta-curcumene synthase
LINRGLLSIYLADDKVSQQKNIRKVSRKLLRLGGIETIVFYLHCRIYRRLTD